MGYLGQEYKQGLVIQRSDKGSAFQEIVTATIEGEVEINAKLPGGIKKLNLTGGGGGQPTTKTIVFADAQPGQDYSFFFDGPIVVKPDTKEPYATIQELGNVLTKDDVLDLLDQFIEDYNLGTLYVTPDEESTEYVFSGYLLLENNNYELNVLNIPTEDFDPTPTDPIDIKEPFVTNYVEINVCLLDTGDCSRKITLSFPTYGDREIALCYWEVRE